MKTAKIGKSVPKFQLKGTQSQDYDVDSFKGQRVILYFYPKDHTPGCTVEGHEFSKLKKSFDKLNTVIFGVSRDSLQSHEAFKEKQCYSINLLSDENEIACQIFDVIKEKNMYGKKVLGIERSTFLIDEKGVLLHEWRKVKAQGHAQEVLDYLKFMNR